MSSHSPRRSLPTRRSAITAARVLLVASAEAPIHALDPHAAVTTYPTRLPSGNAMELLADYDVIVDGSDNVATRYFVDDACGLLRETRRLGERLQIRGPGIGRRGGR